MGENDCLDRFSGKALDGRIKDLLRHESLVFDASKLVSKALA